MWNYVVTVQKPTAVTHSCVGNFTGPCDINLIIAKCTRIEIHSLSSEGLQQILDVPIYGRIATLELFRPDGEQQDSIFISTETNKLSVLQWDIEAGDLIIRAMADVSDRLGIPVENGNICIVDPDSRVIGLHLYSGVFKIIAFDNIAGITHDFNITLDKFVEVLDIKFLYGRSKPTIAVLYQYEPNCIYKDERHVRTYEVDVDGRNFNEAPWLLPNLDYGARLLIPVPMPFGGVIIIGEKTIVYFGPSVSKAVPTPNSMSIIQAYCKIDGFRYLLSDRRGRLHLLAITHEKELVTGLNVDFLGETSAASTISYLDNRFVFVGSSDGDSQLVKLPDTGVSYVEVVQTFVNIGPIADFCVVDLDTKTEGGQELVVTCSGGFNHGSLRVLRNGIRINELAASAEFPGIKGIWSLRSSTLDNFDTFLVMSFLGETRILAINSNNQLEETEIQGFVLNTPSLFCQDAIHNQLVQVTADSVRLVSASSGELLSEWRDPTPTGLSITVATANSTQVLLAIEGSHLVYLEIGDRSLREVKRLAIEFDVSCLDINPIGENRNRSELAAAGTWKDYGIMLYSLPDLNFIRSLHFAENVLPRSVLFCRFEGISYLLCGLGDGNLYNFTVNMSSGQLSDRKKISLGSKAITLKTFRYKNTTHVFAASDRSTVIYSRNQRLAYRYASVEKVHHMCSFHSKSFPNSVVVVKEDMFTIGSIDDLQHFYISSVTLGEQPYRICHQSNSRTFAICSTKYNYDERNNKTEHYFIRLLDEKTFENISSYQLDANEEGISILSCSFTDDNNVYYCVGTAYRPDKDNIYKKGRILVFLVVGDRQLCLVSEKETKGVVYTLNAFNGKLLAGIDEKIELYKLVIRDDGSRELEYECGHPVLVLAVRVKTRGDFILVGDYLKSMYLLVYKHDQGGMLEERARDYSANWMTAVEFLDDDIYLGAESNFNIFTAKKNNDAAINDEDQGKLEVEGKYYLGEHVNQFMHGSLALPLFDSDGSKIPTVIFGTVNGMIGVIASLPEKQYQILQKLQMNLVKVIKGVGGLSHEQWRSFSNENNSGDAKMFLDGDLIETFLNLKKKEMDEIATAMSIRTDDLCKMVEHLARLH